MQSNLDRLVNCLLHMPNKQMLPELVLRELESAHLTPECLKRYMHFEKDHYTRNLICKNAHFELLLLCWEPGQMTMVHDHAQQSCWMIVHQGIITSDNYKYVAPKDFAGKLDRIPSESFKAGQCYYIDDTIALHLLKNPVKNQQRTATLHLYAKPFNSCTIYDLEKATTDELKLAYHSMGGKKGYWLAKEIQEYANND